MSPWLLDDEDKEESDLPPIQSVVTLAHTDREWIVVQHEPPPEKHFPQRIRVRAKNGEGPVKGISIPAKYIKAIISVPNVVIPF